MIKNINNNHHNTKNNTKNNNKNNNNVKITENKKTLVDNLLKKKLSLKSDDFYDKVDNQKCITPCYPSNYLIYHPQNLLPNDDNFNRCAVEKTPFFIECDRVTPNFKEINIYNQNGFVKGNPDDFILDLYDLNNIKNIVPYLSNEFDKLNTIITMKRLLVSLFNKFKNYSEFPVYNFSEKFKFVYKKIYKPINKIDYFNELKNIIFLNEDVHDIFIFFQEKFI